MRDIVATIQPDQDDIVRAAADRTICVQGAPGTGKTAVGLHRVAYLLYAYRERMGRRGVLVIGPNQAFLSYIRNVLPALGEMEVTQLTMTDLVAGQFKLKVRATDSDAAARVKGDPRMAEVLRRALWSRLTEPAEGLMLARGSRRWRVPAHELSRLAAELRDRGVRYGAGRDMLANRIAHVVLTKMEAGGEACDDRTHDAVRRTRQVKAVVDAIWPKTDRRRPRPAPAVRRAHPCGVPADRAARRAAARSARLTPAARTRGYRHPGKASGWPRSGNFKISCAGCRPSGGRCTPARRRPGRSPRPDPGAWSRGPRSGRCSWPPGRSCCRPRCRRCTNSCARPLGKERLRACRHSSGSIATVRSIPTVRSMATVP
jgi:hypothetical protein